MLKNTVAPMSMMIIGMRLADLKLKGAFRDIYLYLGLTLRLFVFPAAAFAVLFLCKLLGFYDEIGSIEVGKTADLVIVDDKFNIDKVLLGGEVCKF